MRKLFFYTVTFLVIFVTLFWGLKALDAKKAAFSGKSRTPQADLILVTDYGSVSYRHVSDEILCGGLKTLGCSQTVFLNADPAFELNDDGSLKKLTVRVGIERAIVEISASLPENSCRYGVVLAFESARLLFARKALARYERELKRNLTRRLNTLNGVFTRTDYEDLKEIVQKYMRQVEKARADKERQFETLHKDGYNFNRCTATPASVVQFMRRLGL